MTDQNEIKECSYCGFSAKVDTHHIIPLSEGGCECDNNKTFLCPNHHAIITYDSESKEAKNIMKHIPEGMLMEECENCNEKFHATNRIFKILCILNGYKDVDESERMELIQEMSELLNKFDIDLEYILHTKMGFSYETIEKWKENKR